jgi:hypothetical protein
MEINRQTESNVEDFHNFHSLTNIIIISVIESRRMRWAEHGEGRDEKCV